MNDQEFLNQAVQRASDEDEKKIMLLHYQQAVFQTLQSFQPCETCLLLDLTLLRKRTKKLLITTQHYLDTVAVVPMQRVINLIAETQTVFLDIAQFCPECLAHIQQYILATFRTVHAMYSAGGYDAHKKR